MKPLIACHLFLLFLCFQVGCVSTSVREKRLIEAEATIKAAKLVGAEFLAPSEIAEAERYYRLAKDYFEDKPQTTGMIAFSRESEASGVKTEENALVAKSAAERAIRKVQNAVEDGVRNVQDENELLKNQNELLQREINNLKTVQDSVKNVQDENELLKNQNQVLQRDVSNLKSTPDALQRKREQYRQESDVVKPENLYLKAFYLFHQEDYEESRKVFRHFLAMFPNHDLSDNAHYWTGECFYRQEKYEQARQAFQTLLADFKDGNKCADALLNLGRCDYHLKNYEKSKQSLQSLIKHYPGTPASRAAGEYLSKYLK
ncbi:MAG: tol-pal system protein YbgF [Pseudomonadota bacterium]